MYFVIGADFVPTESNLSLFNCGDAADLLGHELAEVLDEASYRIFNLEIPLADVEAPITKCGPNLIVPTSVVEGYKAVRVDLFTLANNHIMDQGEQGLRSTKNVLDQAGIAHFGTGDDVSAASKPFSFCFGEKIIGVYACAEHEFSVAEEDRTGANPFDPLWSFDHVAELKRNTDYVVVLYHGGKEHYRYPSPQLQKTCRRFIDKGADLVICQHSHCIGCEETYQSGTIVYGQGNFLFDLDGEECWETGLLVKVEDDFTVSYIPLVRAKNSVRLAEGEKAEEILRDFRTRSEEIRRPGAVQQKYKEFADAYLNYYLLALSGRKSIFFRIINKLSGGALIRQHFRNIYRKENQVNISNYIDCEAHRELMSQALANTYR